MTDERALPLDDDEQTARCRALEMMVLLRALLDAVWSEVEFAVARPRMTAKDRSVAHAMMTYRAQARRWLLAPVNKEDIDVIAERAGLSDGKIWEIVQRFVRDGEDPAPLRHLYQVIGDRPGRKNFALDVSSVV